MANVVIVSNRLPVSVKKVDGELQFSRSIGGLATGLASYTGRRGNRWIGWPGIVAEELTETDKQMIIRRLKRDRCYPVFLTRKQVDDFYNGFSNSILWPAFHNLPLSLDNHERYWSAYRRVNQLFADAVLTLSVPKSIIWVHDYQLMLVPQMLRSERPYDNIGFFLHTPFPDTLTFEGLPHAKSLLKGLLGAELVGFHTPSYVDNFLDTAQAMQAGTVVPGQVILPDHVVQVTDFPISIDYAKYATASRQRAVQRELRQLRKRYARYKVILAFDRLDLTKGFLERLEAYRQFLAENPNQRGKVKLLMIAAPSRTDLPAYRELKDKIELLVDEINVEFGTTRWKPVDYTYEVMPFEKVTALYQIADIAFITPLKDGMNLMAKEYVAAKRNKNGVLILSQTAGAAEELTHALLVDPRRPRTMVNALSKAVTMQSRELRDRLTSMQEHLSTHTIQHWANNFMHSLQQPSAGLQQRVHHLRTANRRELLKDFRQAERRLILLDYDGVLAEFQPHPKHAAPTPSIYRRLQKLAAQPKNEVVLISGRSRRDLEEWFGELPISLAAEHGALYRMKGRDWRKRSVPSSKWKQAVRPVLEKYAAQTPGAFVETKETGLVWHYRKASAYYAQKNGVILKQVLKPALKPFGLGLYSGNGILEVKPRDTNKGSTLGYWLRHKPDFILAIGDDYTDEDMFLALPSAAYTIKVGPGRTAARFRIPSVDEVSRLLTKLQ